MKNIDILFIIVMVIYLMVLPFFEDSNVKCEYRGRCALAQILWLIALFLGIAYIID